MDSLPNFITYGASLSALRARGGSAKNDLKNQDCVFHHPRVKHFYYKSACLKLRNFDWIKLRGSYVTGFQTSLFCAGKLATFTDFVTKCKSTLYFRQRLFRNLQ